MSLRRDPARKLRIAIIGADPGALCMGVRLRQARFEDFGPLEKGQAVGGTGYHDRYPGCACDPQSALHSFSFELERDWSRPHASQPEIPGLDSFGGKCFHSARWDWEHDLKGRRVWNESCPGSYRSASGRGVTQWPFSTSEFRERTRKPDLEAYETRRRSRRPGDDRATGAAT